MCTEREREREREIDGYGTSSDDGSDYWVIENLGWRGGGANTKKEKKKEFTWGAGGVDG